MVRTKEFNRKDKRPFPIDCERMTGCTTTIKVGEYIDMANEVRDELVPDCYYCKFHDSDFAPEIEVYGINNEDKNHE